MDTSTQGGGRKPSPCFLRGAGVLVVASNLPMDDTADKYDTMILSKEIEERVFALLMEERARLADRLLISLESPAQESWFCDIDSEIKGRVEAAQRGEIATVDGEQALGCMWDLVRK